MDIYIKLKNYENTQPQVSLQYAALEIEQLNTACSELLVNGPIKVNPNSTKQVPILDSEGNQVIEYQYETVQVLDSNGDPVLDAEGNPTYETKQVLDENNNPIGTPQYEDIPFLEGFIGDANTVPNELGYVTVRINNYESFEWEVMPTTFIIVSGYPRRGENNDILLGNFI
jgi:hypothetical protein